MMRHARLLAAALALAGLAGCSSTSNFATNFANGINTVTAALSSPQASQAVANLKAGADALICNIASLDAEAAKIETGIAGGSVATIDPKSSLGKAYEVTSTVLTVSQTVCTDLGGAIGGNASISSISNGVATAAPVGVTK